MDNPRIHGCWLMIVVLWMVSSACIFYADEDPADTGPDTGIVRFDGGLRDGGVTGDSMPTCVWDESFWDQCVWAP